MKARRRPKTPPNAIEEGYETQPRAIAKRDKAGSGTRRSRDTTKNDQARRRRDTTASDKTKHRDTTERRDTAESDKTRHRGTTESD